MLFQRPHLLIPLIFFASYLALDRLFALPAIRRHTQHWTNVEDVFYESRERLFRLLEQEHAAGPEQGLVLVFGSSRSAPFPPAWFAERVPGARLYNFSAPSAAPAYYAYWLERIAALRPEPRINAAVVEIDSGLFARAALQPSLAYAYDPGFMLGHFDLLGNGNGFALDAVETFFLKRVFATYRYPVKISNVIDNHKKLTFFENGEIIETNQLAIRDRLEELMDQNFDRFRGGIPYPVPNRVPPHELEDHAARTMLRYAGAGKPLQSQLYFFRLTLEHLAARDVPVILYWPVVSEPLRRRMLEAELVQPYKDQITNILADVRKKHPGARLILVDPNDDPGFRCRVFSDSFHLEGACYGELSEYLWRRMP